MNNWPNVAPGVYVEYQPSGGAPIEGASTSTPAFLGWFSFILRSSASGVGTIVGPNTPKLCHNMTDFTNYFGAQKGEVPFVSTQSEQAHFYLFQAVSGFFQNGGTKCYVIYVEEESDAALPERVFLGTWSDITTALENLEPIDDISMLAAPAMVSDNNYKVGDALIDHCRNMGNRFAILDAPNLPPAEMLDAGAAAKATQRWMASSWCGVYYPWLRVPNPDSNSAPGSTVAVPPSGHVAGICARVDAQRGVNKAPANESVRGVVDVEYPISPRQQGDLNPQGINCIRWMNNSIKVWGARTYCGSGGFSDLYDIPFKYVSTRRFFNYLYSSLESGTQWAVFEPNNTALWANLIRNITAFLTPLWAQGALFGDKPSDAFYVKCDAENNPPASRAEGKLNIEVGVAVVYPAEFVLIKVTQWSGPTQAGQQ